MSGPGLLQSRRGDILGSSEGGEILQNGWKTCGFFKNLAKTVDRFWQNVLKTLCFVHEKWSSEIKFWVTIAWAAAAAGKFYVKKH